MSHIGGYIKKGGAITAGTVSSLWTTKTSNYTTYTVGAGVCAYALAVEYAAASAISAEIFASGAKIAAISPGSVSLGSLLEVSASGEILGVVQKAATTPAGRTALLAIQKQAAALADAALTAGETAAAQRLINVVYWAGRFL